MFLTKNIPFSRNNEEFRSDGTALASPQVRKRNTKEMYSIPSYRTTQTVLVAGNKLRETGELCKQRGTAGVPHLILSWSRFHSFVNGERTLFT